MQEENRQRALKLIDEKYEIENRIQDFESVLRSNKVGLKSPLVDSEGYPRSDIDVHTIRSTRNSLYRLYNDLKEKENEIVRERKREG